MIEKFRENVAVVVCNREGKVLVCARTDQKEDAWQFPQGGIDAGESVVEAAKRELSEETGITDVSLIAEMPESIKYRFPEKVFQNFKKRGSDFVGQNQHYVLFLLENNRIKIDFETHPEEIEFRAFEWIEPEEAPKRIVYFKKAAYKQAMAFFKPYLNKIKKSYRTFS